MGSRCGLKAVAVLTEEPLGELRLWQMRRRVEPGLGAHVIGEIKWGCGGEGPKSIMWPPAICSSSHVETSTASAGLKRGLATSRAAEVCKEHMSGKPNVAHVLSAEQ